MSHIFLIGFMGAGKSTAAKSLHALTGMPILEMDSEIERRAGMKIPEIFASRGEAAFRRMETRLLHNLKNSVPSIVSCGGGVVTRSINVQEMRAQGTIVLLTARPETVLVRVAHSHNRPLLEGRKTVEDIAALQAERLPLYQAAADLTIATDDKPIRAVAAEILAALDARAAIGGGEQI